MPDRAGLLDYQTGPAANDASISLVTILSVLLRRRWLILGSALGLGVAALVGGLVTPRRYSVSSSFIVQSSDQNAAASIASKLGVDVPGADPTQTPQFYATLVKTPVILERIADTKFATRDHPVPRPLDDIWDIRGDAPVRREKVLERLDRAITSSLGLKVDLVTVTVATRDPILSDGISEAILAELNRFNLDTRQSRAGKERRFTERRMGEVRAELRLAEDQLQRFLESNRQQVASAEVEIERGRLMRQTQLLQQTYLQLAASFERARIDEARDTPSMTVIQRPTAPLLPDPRGLVSKTVLMVGLGFALGLVLAFGVDMAATIGRSPEPEARELKQLFAEMHVGVGRPARKRKRKLLDASSERPLH